MSEEREFVDEITHSGATQYYEVVEAFEGHDVDAFIKTMHQLIAEDSFFLDPYLMVVELLEGAELHDESADMLEKAYQRAVELVTAEDGK